MFNGEKFAPLIGLRDEDRSINTMITTYNTAVTDAPVRCLGRNVAGKSRGSPNMFSTSVMRGEILRRSGMKQKEQKNTGMQTGGFRKVVKKAKENWIGAQCEEIKTCLNKNNSKRADQLVKDLTSEKQGRSSTIQDKSRKCLTEKLEILSRWTEYFLDLHNYNGMATHGLSR